MRAVNSILIPFLICFIFSCEEEQQHERMVTCEQEDDYASLDNYKIDTLCTDSICIEYQSVWKELLMEQNNLTEQYFENHIELFQSRLQNWVQGISFRICYKVKINWAIAYVCDQFIIKIDKESTLFTSLPRDTYLSKDEIKYAVSKHAFSSDIIRLSNIETLQFDSLKHAIQYLINKANVNTMCSKRVFISESTGNLLLEAWGEYVNEYNSCIKGSLDLITGETYITDTNCFIIN